MAHDGQILMPFDPFLKKPCTGLVIAKRGSGKSVFLQDFLFHNRDFFFDVWVFAGSVAVEKDYEGVVPRSRIVRGYSQERMSKIITTAKAWTERAAVYGEPYREICVLCDDCACNKKIFNDPALLEAEMNGRHIHLSVLITTQYLNLVPPPVRSQSDFVAALREPSLESQKKLFRFWFSIIPTFNEFKRVFARATENFGILIANTRSVSNKINKNLFTYKAVSRQDEKFRLCHKRVWKVDKAARAFAKYSAIKLKRERAKAIAGGGLVL